MKTKKMKDFVLALVLPVFVFFALMDVVSSKSNGKSKLVRRHSNCFSFVIFFGHIVFER